MIDKPVVTFKEEQVIEITLKDVYEKAVKIEGYFELLESRNRQTIRKFTNYTAFLILLSIINIAISLWQGMK